MLWILGIIGIVLLVLVIWVNIPYSPVKSEFESMARDLTAEKNSSVDVFTEEDIAGLPEPVQKHQRDLRIWILVCLPSHLKALPAVVIIKKKTASNILLL